MLISNQFPAETNFKEREMRVHELSDMKDCKTTRCQEILRRRESRIQGHSRGRNKTKERGDLERIAYREIEFEDSNSQQTNRWSVNALSVSIVLVNAFVKISSNNRRFFNCLSCTTGFMTRIIDNIGEYTHMT